MVAMPIASGTPRSWYRPKLAASRVRRATITVEADAVMDSPTRRSA